MSYHCGNTFFHCVKKLDRRFDRTFYTSRAYHSFQPPDLLLLVRGLEKWVLKLAKSGCSLFLNGAYLREIVLLIP